MRNRDVLTAGKGCPVGTDKSVDTRPGVGEIGGEECHEVVPARHIRPSVANGPAWGRQYETNRFARYFGSAPATTCGASARDTRECTGPTVEPN